MVKGVIESVTADETDLISVASDTENKAKKTCRLLAREENKEGFLRTFCIWPFTTSYFILPTKLRNLIPLKFSIRFEIFYESYVIRRLG